MIDEFEAALGVDLFDEIADYLPTLIAHEEEVFKAKPVTNYGTIEQPNIVALSKASAAEFNKEHSFASEKQIVDSKAADELPSLDATMEALQAYQAKGGEGLLEVIMKNEREMDEKRKFLELLPKDKSLMSRTAILADALTWAPAGNEWTQALGAIQLAQGHKLTPDLYLAFLNDRVDRLIRAEPNPQRALSWLLDELEEAGLWNANPESLEEAGNVLIYSNLLVQEHLYLKGIPGRLPQRVMRNNARARKLIKHMSLEDWLNLLLDRPSDSR